MDPSFDQSKSDSHELNANVSSNSVSLQFPAQSTLPDQPSSSQASKAGCSRLASAQQRTVESRAYAGVYDVHKELANFWPRVKDKIDALDHATLREANRHQELPLARIKKIMKLDDDVKHQMISAEAPVLLAKAAEIFIEELTLRAWMHTEESKRKTLQKSDISQAVSRYEQFDFLIDIVPRDDTRRSNQASTSVGTGCIEGELIDDKVYATTATAASATPVQFILQVGAPEGALATGSMLQATPIGQPIQLPASNGGQPIQLIALGLPDGNVQQFQVQLPSTS
uniref:Nuclear transcription factor Y subunit gamma n=1 Tax=Parascaris univalens TaxID=6257 RepID=A0A914ZF58_PARUN